MNFQDISYKEMFTLFIAINLLMISIILNLTGNNQLNKEPDIKGVTTINNYSYLDNTYSYTTSTDNISFKYPTSLGQASSEIISNDCHPIKQTEYITFSKFPNFIIGVNVCDLGPNLFIPKTDINIKSETSSVNMIGTIDANYLMNGYSTLILKSVNNDPNIILKVLFNEEDFTRQEILSIASRIIQSFQIN